MPAIWFFTENVAYNLTEKRKLKAWIIGTALAEGYKITKINVILCNDEYLSVLNKAHLNHTTLTDILTFSLGEKAGLLEGEIYISFDRVKENAEKFKTEVQQELRRVIIHGVLHLCGYHDKSNSEKIRMRELEDYYLELFHGQVG